MCKTGLRSIGDQKRKKNQNSGIWEPHSSATPYAPACSQNSERKDLEPGHARHGPQRSKMLKPARKIKMGLLAPISHFLSPLSFLSLLPRSLSLSLSSFPKKIFMYGIFTILYHCLSLPHFFTVIFLTDLSIDFPVWSSKGAYGKS